MTRQEELVWAAAWAGSLRATRTANRPLEARRDIAKEDALEAILELRSMAEDPEVIGSDDEGDVLLRQMAGEPDCFVQRCEMTSDTGAFPFPGVYVYIACEEPQGARCEACASFGGWPGAEVRCPTCGALPERTCEEERDTVYACRCGRAWVGPKKEEP